MKDELWTLFCDTGDAMGYLLYKAAGTGENAEKPATKEEAASV